MRLNRTPLRAVRLAARAAAAIFVAGPAAAGVVVHRLGEQDFPHAAGPIWVAQAAAAGAGEAHPFDGTVFGDDRNRRFGKLAFTHTFPAPLGAGDGALTLGLVGLDSPPGSPATVRLYLDGVEQPNDLFAGASSAAHRSSASVVTVPVAADLLADGSLTVLVKAFRPSPGFVGNAIGADFSTLAVEGPAVGIPPDDGGAGPIDPGQPGGTPVAGGNPTQPGTGGGVPPPATIPFPPAAYAGAVGLLLAAIARRRA